MFVFASISRPPGGGGCRSDLGNISLEFLFLAYFPYFEKIKAGL
jgi:hypothetical protein